MAQTASVHVRYVLSVTTCPLCLVGYALSVSSGRAAACGVVRGAWGADPHVDPDAAGAQQVADELDVPGGHVGTLGHVTEPTLSRPWLGLAWPLAWLVKALAWQGPVKALA